MPNKVMQEAAVKITSNDFSIISLIGSSDLVGKIVLLLLAIASVWSWAVIISKLRIFVALKCKINNFEKLLWKKYKLKDIFDQAKTNQNNPLARITLAGVAEIKNSDNPSNEQLRQSFKDRIQEAMILERNKTLQSLETRLNSLATIGSSAPFIGLFGTVWGIMHSFSSIAVSKNASLAVVAPGIAEALLATGVGLFVAIPATMFYNYLSREIDVINDKIDNFIGNISISISRDIDKGGI